MLQGSKHRKPESHQDEEEGQDEDDDKVVTFRQNKKEDKYMGASKIRQSAHDWQSGKDDSGSGRHKRPNELRGKVPAKKLQQRRLGDRTGCVLLLSWVASLVG